jgi:cytochrome c biogenesis protein
MNHKEKGIFDVTFDFFRSIKLTIFLLFLIAIVSIIGTLIKQNAPSAEYIHRYGIQLYNVLDFFNLFNMYNSWWFTALLLLLVINLIACSLHRFPGLWRQISGDSETKDLGESMLKTLPYVERINRSYTAGGEEVEIHSILKKRFGNPKRFEGGSSITFYSEKGRFSRLGAYITHLSILVILIGGIIGSLFGFRGFVNILEGETVDHIALRIQDEEKIKPIGFSIRCDDFRVIFYDLERPEKLAKEYSSDLTIVENGKEILKKTVEVNHPLHYRGLTFYQSSYGSIPEVALGVQSKKEKKKTVLRGLEGETIRIPHSDALVRILKYAPQVHNFGEGVQVVLLKPNQPPRALWLLKDAPKLDQQHGDDFVLTLEEINTKEYTGLQVTKDPGVWVVWIGCSLMIIGLIVSFFFSHQRLWVRIPVRGEGEIVLAGSANKNRVEFERKFGNLVDEIRKKVQG